MGIIILFLLATTLFKTRICFRPQLLQMKALLTCGLAPTVNCLFLSKPPTFLYMSTGLVVAIRYTLLTGNDESTQQEGNY